MASENRAVQDFSKIELLGAGHIHLVQADEYSLVIEAEANVLALITSDVRGETLVLDIERGHKLRMSESIHYFISLPQIEVLRIAGGGTLEAETIRGNSFLLEIPGGADINIGTIAVKAFRLDVQGAVKMRLNRLQAQGVSFDIQGSLELKLADLQAEALTSNIEGTCNIEMAGETRAQIIHAPGVINYQAGHLESSQVTVNAQGMANITLWVQDSLNVRLEGVGNLRYYGNPERKVKIHGLANVQRIADKPKVISYA